MVAVLVREHVGLGEGAAARAEAVAQLVEEAEVDVDGLVGRAVERADVRGGDAAAGLRLAGEEARRRLAVAVDRVAPVRLHRVDDGDDAAVLALVGVAAGAARLRQVARRRGRPSVPLPIDSGSDPPSPPGRFTPSSASTTTMMIAARHPRPRGRARRAPRADPGPARCRASAPGRNRTARAYLAASLVPLGEIAQLVEHTTENRGVPGSSPGLAISSSSCKSRPGSWALAERVPVAFGSSFASVAFSSPNGGFRRPNRELSSSRGPGLRSALGRPGRAGRSSCRGSRSTRCSSCA